MSSRLLFDSTKNTLHGFGVSGSSCLTLYFWYVLQIRGCTNRNWTKGGIKAGVHGSCTKIPVGIKGEEQAIVLRILDISNQSVPPCFYLFWVFVAPYVEVCIPSCNVVVQCCTSAPFEASSHRTRSDDILRESDNGMVVIPKRAEHTADLFHMVRRLVFDTDHHLSLHAVNRLFDGERMAAALKSAGAMDQHGGGCGCGLGFQISTQGHT